MRIRVDINELSAMADTLSAGARTLAEIGNEVCACDLPASVAASFEQNRAAMRANFDGLAKAYNLLALELVLRALIATKDVNKAVAIYPPASAPAAIQTGQPVVAAASAPFQMKPGVYYTPGGPQWSRMTPAQRQMNEAMTRSIVMPMVMSNFRQSEARYNASMSAMFEPSTYEIANRIGGNPSSADIKHYAPNTYKSRYGDS